MPPSGRVATASPSGSPRRARPRRVWSGWGAVPAAGSGRTDTDPRLRRCAGVVRAGRSDVGAAVGRAELDAHTRRLLGDAHRDALALRPSDRHGDGTFERALERSHDGLVDCRRYGAGNGIGLGRDVAFERGEDTGAEEGLA